MHNYFKLLNGESSTNIFKSFLSIPPITAVTAPIDLPHTPNGPNKGYLVIVNSLLLFHPIQHSHKVNLLIPSQSNIFPFRDPASSEIEIH